MAYTITRTNYLEVNSVPLSTPAWYVHNLEPALLSRTLRGSDLVLPGAPGRRRRRRRIDEHIAQLEMTIRGKLKWDGTVYSDVTTGFVTNCEQLLANLGFANATAVTATWHRRDSSTKTASVDIVGFTIADLGTFRDGKAVLELAIPAGAFA